MSEKRFSYNPFTKQFIDCGLSHTGKTPIKTYDDFIRGILQNDILYLRVYYPFEDFSELSYNELIQKSDKLLQEFKADILKTVKKHYSIIPINVIYNVTNDNLKGYLNTPFV